MSVAIYCQGQLFGENQNSAIMLEQILLEEIEKLKQQGKLVKIIFRKWK